MSTDAIDIPNTTQKQTPSRRDRRAYYAMARRQAKIAKKPLAPWGQTPLCVPNPTVHEWPIDSAKPMTQGNIRRVTLGDTWDGVPLQRAQCIRGSCLERC